MALSQLTSTLAQEEAKLLACIHCGLCLEACPTYTITGDENDGPRGRLYLMRAVGEGRLRSDSAAFERHIDRCLGCRACEQVCPAGVEYGQLLEAARGELFTSGKTRGFSYGVFRLLLKHVWLQPSRLRFVFAVARLFRDAGLPRALLKSGIARVLPRRIQFSLALLESSAAKLAKPAGPLAQAALSEPRLVGVAGGPTLPTGEREANSDSPASRANPTMLFTGCVGEGLFARVNQATTRVLQANGFAVELPHNQVCCGALHAHAGDLVGARTLARMNIDAFRASALGDGAPMQANVITNAGGCGAMLASYGHLLADDEIYAEQAHEFSERVCDVSQQLETVVVRSGAGVAEKVTYDSSCHLLYGQHAGEAPLQMLGAVSELNFARLEGSEKCCGGAGIYNILEPELSREVLNEKLANIRNTGAKILATGNPGCQMQIGAGAMLAGLNLTVCHPVELLDESYRRAGMYENSDG
ncbi:MAG: 4Fe-4S dicluster domain-containing protein [Pyrinomonadaceae bacterium]|nr:4Fe-4S dicluster domain-containing protein [Pyrinomonadaceae bacterium]